MENSLLLFLVNLRLNKIFKIKIVSKIYLNNKMIRNHKPINFLVINNK